MYPNMYQIMPPESVHIFRRCCLTLDEIGGAQKEAAPPSIGPQNDRGVEIGTIPNKSAFLLGTPAVSGIKY